MLFKLDKNLITIFRKNIPLKMENYPFCFVIGMEKSVRTHANNYLFLLDFYNDYELFNFAEVVTRIAARKSVVSSARIRKLLLPQSVFLFAIISTVLAFALPLLVPSRITHTLCLPAQPARPVS